MNSEQRRSEEGVVLLLVLVIIVVSISMVGSFARSSALDVVGMRHRADRGRAELLAQSGVAVATRALKDDLARPADPPLAGMETPLDPWYAIGERSVELPDHGELRVRVRDMGAKINLNGLVDESREAHADSREFLTAALKHVIDRMPGRDEDHPYDPKRLADAILDWLDADVRTRRGALEDEAYRRLGARTRPANRELHSLGELADLPTVDAALLDAMRHYFTVHPSFGELGDSGLNPNTAPGWALGMIYLGGPNRRDLIESREVLATLQARARGRIFCPVSDEQPCNNFTELLGQAGETAFPPLAYSNSIFEIESVAHYRDATACITAVVERLDAEQVRPIAYERRCR